MLSIDVDTYQSEKGYNFGETFAELPSLLKRDVALQTFRMCRQDIAKIPMDLSVLHKSKVAIVSQLLLLSGGGSCSVSAVVKHISGSYGLELLGLAAGTATYDCDDYLAISLCLRYQKTAQLCRLANTLPWTIIAIPSKPVRLQRGSAVRSARRSTGPSVSYTACKYACSVYL